MSGQLGLSFAPSPSVTSCSINYYTQVIYGVPLFGWFHYYPADAAWKPVTDCKSKGATVYVSPLKQLKDALAQANRVSFVSIAAAATQPDPPAGGTMTARDATVTDHVTQTVNTQGVVTGRQETTLVSGAPITVAAPAIASGPNGRLALAWVGENLSNARPKSFQTRLRLYNGHAWSATAPFVGDGQHPNSMPSVAFAGNGDVVVAWSVNQTPNLSATTPIESQFANVQIEVVTCDGTTGAVKSRRILSSGAGPHAKVQATAAADGSVWVAWQNLAPGDYATASAPAPLLAARWDKANWSAPEVVAGTIAGLQGWQIAGHDAATAVVAYDETVDGKRSVHAIERANGTWKESFTKSAAPVNDPRIAAAYATSGKSDIAWSDGPNVMHASGGSASTLLANAAGMPVALAPSGSGTSVLLRSATGYSSMQSGVTGKSATPVVLTHAISTLSAPGAAHAGSDWILVAAPLTITAGKTPSLGGAAIVLNAKK